MSSLPTCYRHPDRETGVACSECGRPICPDCMVFAPVGIRCPEHAGQTRRLPPSRAANRLRVAGGEALVTRALIAINVGIYLLQLAGGAPLNANSGWIYDHGALVANGSYGNFVGAQPAGVAHGEWWRLITAAFLHYGPLHLAMNMLVLWFVGGPIEHALGRVRFLGVYLVSGLAGSAGALLAEPNSVTVGASGAIWGLFGALLILEYEHTGRLVGGPAFTLIALNAVLTFAIPNISWGGHLGGFVGGTLGTLALSHFRRRSPAYQAADALGMAALIGVGVLSVVVAYWKVHSLGVPA